MNQHTAGKRAIGSRGPRVIRVSGVANAIRAVLTVSAATLLATGALHAQTHATQPLSTTAAATDSHTNMPATAPVDDLSSVTSGPMPAAVSASAGASGSGVSIAITNKGDIHVEKPGQSIGLYSYAAGGRATTTNSGSVTATSTDGGLADGIFSYADTVKVNNSGPLDVAGYSWVAGIEAKGGDQARVDNSGQIDFGFVAPPDPTSIESYSHMYGIFATGGDGGLTVNNRGDITGKASAYASGIHATETGTGDLHLTNAGAIKIDAAGELDPETGKTAGGGMGTGIFATSAAPGSDIVLNNSGSVYTSGFYRGVTSVGVIANGDGSKATVVNSGDITAVDGNPDQPSETKYSVQALFVSAGDDVSIKNTGTIHAQSLGGDFGIRGVSTNGDVTINNSGEVRGASYKYLNQGIYADAAYGDANVVNSGSVVLQGAEAYGIKVRGAQGAAVSNSGLIDIGASADPVHLPTGLQGIIATSSLGDVGVQNKAGGRIDLYGAVDSKYGGMPVHGIYAHADTGDASVTNAGVIQVRNALKEGAQEAFGSMRGIAASANGQGDVAVTNRGEVTLLANGVEGEVDKNGQLINTLAALGLAGTTEHGDIKIINSGTLTTTSNSKGSVIGARGSTVDGSIALSNTGTLQVQSDKGDAAGLVGTSSGGKLSLSNGGSLNVTGSTAATGLSGTAVGGSLKLANTAQGTITVHATKGDATGLLGTVTGAAVTFNNAGTIDVSSDAGGAYGIRLLQGDAADVSASRNALTNSGSIDAAIAIYGNDGADAIRNSGSIRGAIVTNGGDDSLTNLAGGTWAVSDKTTDFGAGNDSVTNARGATLQLSDAGLSFGAGKNSFSNSGTIKVSGSNRIDLTDGSASAALAALQSPKGAAAFTNNGVIDFVDGAADDSLSIVGGFAGSGAINLDVSLSSGRNDQLFVNGATAAGTRQIVNVALLDGLPKSGDVGKQLELVHVSGGTTPSAFAAGNVLGVSPRDFLTLGLTLGSQPDKGAKLAAGGTGSSYLLSVTTKVNGLNAAGVLASSAAMGVDSLLTSSTGNWRDRQYALSAAGGKPAFATIAPWVRGFDDQGGMNPDHLASNFGQMANARMSQDNHGTEMGLELQGRNGWRVGTVFAQAQGRQYLLDERGMDTLRGNSMGLYATWLGESGLYVDASWRTMRFDANIDSIGGRQRTEGNAFSTNVEAGYQWTLGNGLNIAPKLQYTSTAIDGLQIAGDEATFQSQQARWTRGQAGVSLWNSHTTGSGWRVTPYGEFSLLRTFDGVANYAVNDDYFGRLVTEGTSMLVNVGLGAQKGHLSWKGGLNWMDGAAYDGALGGQMTLRYTW